MDKVLFRNQIIHNTIILIFWANMFCADSKLVIGAKHNGYRCNQLSSFVTRHCIYRIDNLL